MIANFLPEAVRYALVMAAVLLAGVCWKVAGEPKLSRMGSVAVYGCSAYFFSLAIAMFLKGNDLTFAFNASWITAVVLFVVAYCAGTKRPGVSTEYAFAYGIVFMLFAVAMGVTSLILYALLHHQRGVAIALALGFTVLILLMLAQGRKS